MIPAPLRGSLAPARSLLLWTSSPDPLHGRSRGPHDPRSARAAHSRPLVRSCSGLRPQTPYTVARGDPMIPAPLARLTRSRSFAPDLDFVPRPLTQSLAGTPSIPAPLLWLTRARSFAPDLDFVPRPLTQSLAPPPTVARGPRLVSGPFLFGCDCVWPDRHRTADQQDRHVVSLLSAVLHGVRVYGQVAREDCASIPRGRPGIRVGRRLQAGSQAAGRALRQFAGGREDARRDEICQSAASGRQLSHDAFVGQVSVSRVA